MRYESVKGAQLIDMIVTNRLPVLSVNGKKFTQSLAALRYTGKKSNLKLSLSVSSPYFLPLASMRVSTTSLLNIPSLSLSSKWMRFSTLLKMC